MRVDLTRRSQRVNHGIIIFSVGVGRCVHYPLPSGNKTGLLEQILLSRSGGRCFLIYLENSIPFGGGASNANLLSGESKGAQTRVRSPSRVHGTRTVKPGPWPA